jgi:two-component system, NtrC family, nitrogen regulation sensor histidine kinase NtrY
MKKRLGYAASGVALVILLALLFYQGSFALDAPGATSANAGPYVLWSVAALILVLAITLGFMLTRDLVKLYVARQSNREGSRLQTKLVVGALGLTLMPVAFLMVYSLQVLGHNLDRWFYRPVENVVSNLREVSGAFERETQLRAEAQARWIAGMPEVRDYIDAGAIQPPKSFAALCAAESIKRAYVEVVRKGITEKLALCGAQVGPAAKAFTVRAALPGGTGWVVVSTVMGVDLAARQDLIASELQTSARLAANRREFRAFNLLLMTGISLFIMLVAAWIARFLSRQISQPISALVTAAGEIRKGHLSHRIKTPAIDELATLVRAFNEMAEEVESSEGELERRRQFIEAILESIPTGVITLGRDRRIQRVNPAFSKMMGNTRAHEARFLEDLFPPEESREVHYLLNRARRTGAASSQLDFAPSAGAATLHLSLTASALEGKDAHGFVVAVEDTSELLRAQKASAWHEVARRVAHEIKNPLTPISLSAERIARQLERLPAGRLPSETERILRECSLTISGEVESVRALVDEFSQFARFPEAQPAQASINDIVESALGVFTGRLDGVEVVKHLADGLPALWLDREQFKRVMVNLIDNAAEAMIASHERRLVVETQLAGSDTVEVLISDTGHGIPAEDRERLFLPYFSTKNRGTGLGLAIVHHILDDHGARIRVESNAPAGSRFVIELPIAQDAGDAALTTLTSTAETLP